MLATERKLNPQSRRLQGAQIFVRISWAAIAVGVAAVCIRALGPASWPYFTALTGGSVGLAAAITAMFLVNGGLTVNVSAAFGVYATLNLVITVRDLVIHGSFYSAIIPILVEDVVTVTACIFCGVYYLRYERPLTRVFWPLMHGYRQQLSESEQHAAVEQQIDTAKGLLETSPKDLKVFIAFSLRNEWAGYFETGCRLAGSLRLTEMIGPLRKEQAKLAEGKRVIRTQSRGPERSGPTHDRAVAQVDWALRQLADDQE